MNDCNDLYIKGSTCKNCGLHINIGYGYVFNNKKEFFFICSTCMDKSKKVEVKGGFSADHLNDMAKMIKEGKDE